jgi:acetyl/propionyl-CoA carboxylase alpha subunit
MTRALKEYRIRGVTTNLAFLENLLAHLDFLANLYTTNITCEAANERSSKAAIVRGPPALGTRRISQYELPLSRLVAEFDVDTDRYELRVLARTTDGEPDSDRTGGGNCFDKRARGRNAQDGGDKRCVVEQGHP